MAHAKIVGTPMKRFWLALGLWIGNTVALHADDPEVARLREDVKQMRKELNQLRGKGGAQTGLRREDAGNKTLDQPPAAAPSTDLGIGNITPEQQRQLMQELGKLKKQREESNQLLKELEKDL